MRGRPAVYGRFPCRSWMIFSGISGMMEGQRAPAGFAAGADPTGAGKQPEEDRNDTRNTGY